MKVIGGNVSPEREPPCETLRNFLLPVRHGTTATTIALVVLGRCLLRVTALLDTGTQQ